MPTGDGPPIFVVSDFLLSLIVDWTTMQLGFTFPGRQAVSIRNAVVARRLLPSRAPGRDRLR